MQYISYIFNLHDIRRRWKYKNKRVKRRVNIYKQFIASNVFQAFENRGLYANLP